MSQLQTVLCLAQEIRSRTLADGLQLLFNILPERFNYTSIYA